MSQDLRQAKLLEPFKHVAPEVRESVAILLNEAETAGRVREAIAKGHVATPTFIPEFYADKTYIESLQWLAFFSIRGYFSEHQKAASLDDIYSRVLENIRASKRERTWPEGWGFPRKRSIDRRVNEIASAKPHENHIMHGAKPRAIAATAGFYLPNPALYEDVAKKLEASTR